MTIAKNNSQRPKQIKTAPTKAFYGSPYCEATTVVRVPESLLLEVYRLLDQCRQDVEDAAWLSV